MVLDEEAMKLVLQRDFTHLSRERSSFMTTEEIIIQIFCAVDDEMSAMPKHPQACLYPSELVTIGLLFALKGGHFRAFYRWCDPRLRRLVCRVARSQSAATLVGHASGL